MKRDALILTIAAIIAVIVGALIFFSNGGNLASVFSATANNDSSGGTVQFTEIARGTQSNIGKRVNYFITSSSQFSELWEIVNATGTPPEVDFKTHAVIAVFAGNESSTSIAVAKIEDTDTRVVSIALANPSGSCVSKQRTATPYEIVVVPTTSLPLAHEDIVTTVSCPK